MKSTMTLSLAALLLAAPPAFAQQRFAQGQQVQGGTAGRINTPVSTETFVQRAAASSRFAIKSSELAKRKADSKVLKGFAQEMIRDHTTASQRMYAALGNRAHAPGAVVQESTFGKIMRELDQASGEEFDRLYTQAQVKAHEAAVDLFRTYAASGTDDDLRAFAKEMLPTLERHRVRVLEIAQKHV